MSEQHLKTNPEFMLHYKRLRRERAMTRRRGYLSLVVAGVLLASGFFFENPFYSTKSETLVSLLVFLIFSLLLLSNGLLALWQSRQPIKDDEVTRRRQEERQQLFQFAQGHHYWHYWLASVIQALVGLFFLWLGIQNAWLFVTLRSSLNPLLAVLSFAFLLFAWYALSRAISRAISLRRLARLSSQELADRLSQGEVTDGE